MGFSSSAGLNLCVGQPKQGCSTCGFTGAGLSRPTCIHGHWLPGA